MEPFFVWGLFLACLVFFFNSIRNDTQMKKTEGKGRWQNCAKSLFFFFRPQFNLLASSSIWHGHSNLGLIHGAVWKIPVTATIITRKFSYSINVGTEIAG